MDVSALVTAAFVLIAIGIVIVLLVIVVASGKQAKKDGENGSKIKGAGVIMIGPIPIIFGTDKKSVKTVVTLALVLTIALIIWYYLMLK